MSPRAEVLGNSHRQGCSPPIKKKAQSRCDILERMRKLIISAPLVTG
jgi:hypothetical protein